MKRWNKALLIIFISSMGITSLEAHSWRGLYSKKVAMQDQQDQTDIYAIPLDSSEAEEEQELQNAQNYGKNTQTQSSSIEETSVNEDLMREHGILDRILLIYQEIVRRIENHQDFPLVALADSAKLVRNFIENYHERLEEEYIFPKFERTDLWVLVNTLKEQHQAGRQLTDYILAHATAAAMQDDIQKKTLADYLRLYIRMYRPHEAREDTVLFPAFRKLLSEQEYTSLGKIFEEKEEQLFGKDGFNKAVKAVSEIEKLLGIYHLSQFTPKLVNP